MERIGIPSEINQGPPFGGNQLRMLGPVFHRKKEQPAVLRSKIRLLSFRDKTFKQYTELRLNCSSRIGSRILCLTRGTRTKLCSLLREYFHSFSTLLNSIEFQRVVNNAFRYYSSTYIS